MLTHGYIIDRTKGCKMAVPKFDKMMNAALKAFRELGGSASIAELEEKVAAILKLSEDDINEIHRANITKFSFRLAWTRNYLKRYGLLDNSTRGVWSLTQKGQEAKAVDEKEVIKVVKEKDKKATGDQEEKNDESIASSIVEEELTWKEELIEILQGMKPASFERLCQRLLRESGFVQVEVTGKSGDGGIDGKGIIKIGGLISFKVIFQCKRYKGSVDPSAVRDFLGTMIGRADKGLFITTGRFTGSARKEAQRDGVPPIDLIDGKDLADKLKELGLGIEVIAKTSEDVKINKDWFGSF